MSREEDKLTRHIRVFEFFFPEVLFNFAPGISRIFGLMVLIPEIQQLAEFLETFPGNFCTICSSFQIFAKGKKVKQFIAVCYKKVLTYLPEFFFLFPLN